MKDGNTLGTQEDDTQVNYMCFPNAGILQVTVAWPSFSGASRFRLGKIRPLSVGSG